MILAVKVKPRGRQSRCEGVHDGALVIRLAAPPVDGKANHALIGFLARQLGVRRSQVELLSGEKSRLKTVGFEGISKDQARKCLGLPGS